MCSQVHLHSMHTCETLWLLQTTIAVVLSPRPTLTSEEAIVILDFVILLTVLCRDTRLWHRLLWDGHFVWNCSFLSRVTSQTNFFRFDCTCFLTPSLSHCYKWKVVRLQKHEIPFHFHDFHLVWVHSSKWHQHKEAPFVTHSLISTTASVWWAVCDSLHCLLSQ